MIYCNLQLFAFFPPQEIKQLGQKESSRDFLKEYISEMPQGEFPCYLLHYVHYRMEILLPSYPRQEVMQLAQMKTKNFPRDVYTAQEISTMFMMNGLPIDFDFDIKYKKIKETKGERPHPLLNYLARESEILEGFEAGETLLSYYRITPNIKLVSQLALFEQWVTEKQHYDEVHHLGPMAEEMKEDIEKITGTFKYGLGWIWDIEMHHQRKMSVEFLMQQKTNNQWQVQQRELTDSKASGVLFDHWVITFTLDF